MRWNRVAALVLALMVLPLGAFAEQMPEPTRDPELTETVHAVVESLFAAAAGTNGEMETEAREDKTEEELEARTLENRQYREKTLPWLVAALEIEEENVEPETSPSPTPVPEPEASPEPAWTMEDSYLAFQQNALGQAYLDLLQPLGGTDLDSCLAVTREYYALWLEEIDHAMLTEMNADYACWIYAPGTQIDYPVVHGEDNSYYLHRLFNGDRNSAGTLFIDYRNLSDFQDPNTLIYGHHMRNDSMFGSLTDYAAQAYFDLHPYMMLIAETEISLLQIFAGYTTSDGDHCYDIAISDEEDMLSFIGEAAAKSDFVSGVEVLVNDRLVTLSTCAYAFEDARYIAIGRIVPVWQQADEQQGF